MKIILRDFSLKNKTLLNIFMNDMLLKKISSINNNLNILFHQ